MHILGRSVPDQVVPFIVAEFLANYRRNNLIPVDVLCTLNQPRVVESFNNVISFPYPTTPHGLQSYVYRMKFRIPLAAHTKIMQDESDASSQPIFQEIRKGNFRQFRDLLYYGSNPDLNFSTTNFVRPYSCTKILTF